MRKTSSVTPALIMRRTLTLAKATARSKDLQLGLEEALSQIVDGTVPKKDDRDRKAGGAQSLSKEALLVPAMGIGSGTRKAVELARNFASSIKRVPRVGSSLARQGFERGADVANRTWKPAAGAVRRGGGPPKTQMQRIMDLLDS